MEKNKNSEIKNQFISDSSNQKDDKEKKKYTVLTNRNYVLHETIGDGHCGIVKLATSKKYNCKLAIKIVSKFRAPSEYLKKFFPREIEVVRLLKHPNLIKYYHSIETTHRIYIIMEYAVNGNLFDYIKNNIFVEETKARKWFQQIISVVDYCHEHEIAHRDIKCENLLLDDNFNIKLSDFGLSRRVNDQKELVTTYCGSYAYVAPEILKGKPYNPKISDIWSMGIVLYAMVLGCLPFDDTNYFILRKQIRNEPKFPEKPKISNECRALITRILKPRNIRPTLENIKTDPWFTMEEILVEKSFEDATIKSHNISNSSTKGESTHQLSIDETNNADEMMEELEISSREQVIREDPNSATSDLNED